MNGGCYVSVKECNCVELGVIASLLYISTGLYTAYEIGILVLV